MNKKVVIVQPYVPNYRIGFFDELRTALLRVGVDCSVAAGIPYGEQAKRGDAVTQEWFKPIQIKSFTRFGRSFDIGIDPIPWAGADAVIIGLEGTSFPVYRALVERSFGKVKVGLWGHVWPYSTIGNRVDLILERYQMLCSDHVFAYTPSGAAYAADQGVATHKITTVMNTVDTANLKKDLDSISEADASRFRSTHNFSSGRVVSFIGGLDKIKRIEFLADVLNKLWDKDPTIKILIGGKGPDENFLKEAYSRGQAIPLGYLRGREKALALKASRAICMPGGIGLIAVDALVAGRPIITTDWPFHGPEADYLSEGVSRRTSKNDPGSFAEMIIDACEPGKWDTSDANSWRYPKIESMVDNFSGGIVSMLDA